VLCDECKDIVKCEKCGKRLCVCACIDCGKCRNKGAGKKTEECECEIAS
jgi:hypothetical protein